MNRLVAMLDRPDRVAPTVSTAPISRPMVDRVCLDDDDLLDAWLASLSVDDFERFLSRLAELR